MVVKYPNKNSRSPVYRCPGENHTTGYFTCQYVAAGRVDSEVTELVLEALAPAQLKLSKKVFNHVEAESNAVRDHWRLQLVDAKNEAEAAGRLFKQAAAQNRHVAAQLQNEWEKSLRRVEELKQRERSLPEAPSRASMEKIFAQLTRLTENLRTVWDAPSTETKDRKELVRLLIQDVILIRKRDLIHATVRWTNGGRHELEIEWLSFPRSHSSDAEVIQQVKEMAQRYPDRVIAEKLHSLGYRRRYGQKEFTASSIKDLRKKRNIQSCPDRYPLGVSGPRGDGRYRVRDVAEMIGCSVSLVNALCRAGKLDAIRSASRSPWWISIEENQIHEIAQEVRSRRRRAVAGLEQQKETSQLGEKEGIH